MGSTLIALSNVVVVDEEAGLPESSRNDSDYPLAEDGPYSGAGITAGNESYSPVVIYKYSSNMSQWEKDRIRMEFYATYDVMTGVRIAATLGGFFGLMIMMVLYKSRTNTCKALKDPNIAAVAAEMVLEEEERELQEVLEASGLSLYSDNEYYQIPYRQQRMFSLGNISAPPTIHRERFSSVGGYSSLLDPPRRNFNPKFMKSASVSYEHYEPLNFEDEIRRYRPRGLKSSRQSSIDTNQSLTSIKEFNHRSRRSSRASVEYIPRKGSWTHKLQSLQSSTNDSIKNRSKVFLSNSGRDPDRHKVKLVRLRTSSKEEEDVEEVEEDNALVSKSPSKFPSIASFVVASVDYQDSDLKSVGSDSMFSESYVDTDEDLDQFSSDESVDQKYVRLNTGIYHKLKVKRVDSSPSELLKSKMLGMRNSGNKSMGKANPDPTTASCSSSSSSNAAKSFELKAIARPVGRSTSNYIFPTQPKRSSNEYLYLPGSTKWSKETLF